MKKLIYKEKFPTFWHFVDRYDQDFLLDYKDETEYWKEYTESNQNKLTDLLNEIGMLEKIDSNDFEHFHNEFSYDIHGLNMNSRDEYELWFKKIRKFIVDRKLH
jgi:hypothetical protein